MKNKEDIGADGDATTGSDSKLVYIEELLSSMRLFSEIIEDKSRIGVISSSFMFDGLMHRALIASENLKTRSILSFWRDDLSMENSQIPIFLQIANKVEPDRIITSQYLTYLYNYIDIEIVRDIFIDKSIEISTELVRGTYLARNIITLVATEMYINITDTINNVRNIDMVDSIIRDIALASAMSIVIGTFKDRYYSSNIFHEDELFRLNIIKMETAIFPILAAMIMIMIMITDSKKKTSQIQIDSADLWIGIMTNREALIYYAQKVLNNDIAKESLKDIKLDSKALSSLCAAVCGAVARLKDMKSDFHFIMNCFQTLAWNPDFSETNIGAIKDISRKVVVEKTVKHSDGILVLKELGIPGMYEIYPKKGSGAEIITKPKNSAGMEVEKNLEQITEFGDILSDVVDVWGMEEMKTR